MPTRALGRAVLLTGLLLVLGVVLGRVDLVLLAAPFAIGAALGLRRHARARRPSVTIDADEEHLVEGGRVAPALTVANPDVDRRTTWWWSGPGRSPWLRLEHGDRPFAITVPPDGWAAVELSGDALRWGRHDVGPAAARVAACGGLLACRPVVTPAPRRAGLSGDRAVRRGRGDAGRPPAWSATTGPGGPARAASWPAYAPFAPGDRLRRIDWRVSLRTRELHVAATLSDRDAEVVLLLDVLAEAGARAASTGSASVLDTTVRAAAAIAEHYLQRGDRVSLLEYGAAARRLRPATGRRQYLTVLEWLLDVRPDGRRRAVRARLRRPARAPPTRWWWCSPRWSTRGRRTMLAQLAQSGRFMVAVDTLPAGAGAAAAQRSGRRWPPAVADRTGERARPAARARRAGGDLGRRRQPRPGAAGRGPAGLGAEGALTCGYRPRPTGSTGRRRVLGRATLVPLLVRVRDRALPRRWPWWWPGPRTVAGGRYLLPLIVVALYPAIAPRGRGATVAILVVVAGWIADTTWFDARVALWRVLAWPRCSTSDTR